jgi:curved DNA-binding protein
MSASFQDCYQLLDLPPFAPAEEVRRAWKRMARKVHPDRNQDDPEATERFKQLHDAYRILSNPASREEYDREYSRRTGRARPSSGNGAQQRQESREEPKSKANEQRSRTTAGARNQTPPPRPRPVPDSRRVVTLPLNRFRGGGAMRLDFADGRPSLSFNLPERIHVGEELVLPGHGLKGRQGQARGRLILEIQPELPEMIERDGLDLSMQLQVNVLELIGGTRCTFDHPDGRILSIEIPAGTQPGRQIRLKSQGLPGPFSSGDFLLIIEGRLSAAETAREKRLARKLKALQDKRHKKGA